MTTITLGQLLMLYIWFALAGIILILMLIARFYQRTFDEATHFRLFLLPILGFGAAAIRYASIDRIAGDLVGDVIAALAGLMLIALSLRLYRQMTLHRKPQP